MKRLVAAVWRRLRGPLQWRLLWLASAKYMVGVAGVVRDGEGRVLLLRHRFWPAARPWGLPTGCALKGEEFPMTVVREVKEETGLDVRPGRLLRLTSGHKLRVDVAYEAQLVGGIIKLQELEILEAGWFPVEELPDGLLPSHRELIGIAVNEPE